MKKLITAMATLALATALSAMCFAQQDQSTQSSPSAQQPTSEQQDAQQPSSPSQDPSTAMPAAQVSTFTGTVVKVGGKYVLKTSDMSYQLDDQQKAKQFVGQQVKVAGTLDSNTSTIHVSDISPAS